MMKAAAGGILGMVAGIALALVISNIVPLGEAATLVGLCCGAGCTLLGLIWGATLDES